MDARLIILAAAALLLVLTFVYLVSSVIARRRERRLERLVGPPVVPGPLPVVTREPLALDGWAPDDAMPAVGATRVEVPSAGAVPSTAVAPQATAVAPVAVAPQAIVVPAADLHPAIAPEVVAETVVSPARSVEGYTPVVDQESGDDLLSFLPSAPQPPVRLSVEQALSELESAIAKVGPIEVAAVVTPVEPVAQPAPEPVAQPAPEPVAQPAPEPVAQPAPEPVAQPAPEPVAQPAPEPVAQPAPEPVAQPAPEPVAQPAPEPVAQPAPPAPVNVPTAQRDELAAIAASLEEMMAPAPAATVPEAVGFPALPIEPHAPVPVVPAPAIGPWPASPPVAVEAGAAEPALVADVPFAPEPVPPAETSVRVPEPEIAEYRMISPVEVHFDDGPPRVGIRPGTATFLKFQRLAQVLLTDLKRAKDDV